MALQLGISQKFLRASFNRNIHETTEHQSRELLTRFGLRFVDAVVVSSPAAAAEEAAKLGSPVMLKAQVPFGGRGKQGGVVTAKPSEEVARLADQILGMELRDVTVTHISVERQVSFEREFYVGIAWDTGQKLPVALLGTSGGVDVEQTGEQITRRTFDPWHGLRSHQGREMAAEMGLYGKTLIAVGQVLERLACAFLDYDALVVEINPTDTDAVSPRTFNHSLRIVTSHFV